LERGGGDPLCYVGPVAHAHGHTAGHHHDHRAGTRRALRLSLAFTVAFGVAEAGAGVAFGSLALLADAAHNVSDGAAIAIALLAAWAAGLPARGARTYGWRRAEVLAALVNGLGLVVVSGLVLWQAVARVGDPPSVNGAGVLVVGLVGVAANGVPVWAMLRGGDRRDLNLRAALAHAAADVLGSAAAALAGLLVLVAGWEAADPVLAAVVGVLVLASAVHVIRDSLRVLMELAPRGHDPDAIGQALADMDGVKEVHDLHVWTITSDLVALSVHVVARQGADHDRLLHDAQELLADRFGVLHTTVQIDRDHEQLLQIHRPGCPEAPVPASSRRRQ
jgi:cobalt-zinc-cadmium efflux system protein